MEHKTHICYTTPPPPPTAQMCSKQGANALKPLTT